MFVLHRTYIVHVCTYIVHARTYIVCVRVLSVFSVFIHRMLDDFAHEMDTTDTKMDGVMKKMAKVMHMSNGMQTFCFVGLLLCLMISFIQTLLNVLHSCQIQSLTVPYCTCFRSTSVDCHRCAGAYPVYSDYTFLCLMITVASRYSMRYLSLFALTLAVFLLQCLPYIVAH